MGVLTARVAANGRGAWELVGCESEHVRVPFGARIRRDLPAVTCAARTDDDWHGGAGPCSMRPPRACTLPVSVGGLAARLVRLGLATCETEGRGQSKGRPARRRQSMHANGTNSSCPVPVAHGGSRGPDGDQVASLDRRQSPCSAGVAPLRPRHSGNSGKSGRVIWVIKNSDRKLLPEIHQKKEIPGNSGSDIYCRWSVRMGRTSWGAAAVPRGALDAGRRWSGALDDDRRGARGLRLAPGASG
jgi:hypothetical protein